MILNLLKSILVTATIYHAVPEQTDSTPFITASGSHIMECCPGDHRWLAVSQEILKKLMALYLAQKSEITGAGGFDGIWTVQWTE